MRLFLQLAVLSPVMMSANAFHGNIPGVDVIVKSVLHKMSNYTAYHGPTHSASAIHPATTTGALQNKRQTTSTPYWLEQISHQGISAFGPGGYTVFRNVKDYGARGTFDITIVPPNSCRVVI